MKAASRKIRLRADIERKLWSVDECEAYSGMSAWYWRRAAYAGRISSVKCSNRLLIPITEVDRVISENTRPRMTETVAA